MPYIEHHHVPSTATPPPAPPVPVTTSSRTTTMANNNNNNNALFCKYELGKLLGCDAFAKVYQARNIATGRSVAITRIHDLGRTLQHQNLPLAKSSPPLTNSMTK